MAAVADGSDSHTGQGGGLSSPRFVGEPLLEACYDGSARMGEGDHDSPGNQPVSKVQMALMDLGYDLGPTGADGAYGVRTASAVRGFKQDQHLGFEQFGDVGPGTMGRLDELYPPTLPPCPVNPNYDVFTTAAPADKGTELVSATRDDLGNVSAPAACNPGKPKFRVWVNAFIPTSLQNAKVLTNGPKSGHIVFPGPPFTGCFETDDRLFDTRLGASSRLQMLFDIDSAADVVTLTVRGNDTFEVDCDDGEVFCEKTPSPNVSMRSAKAPNQIALTPVDFTVNFVGQASDPCVAHSPNLRGVGFVGYNLASRRFAWQIDTDFFPAWEAYMQIDGGPTITLLQFMPSPTSTPWRLLAPGAFNTRFGALTF